MSENIEVLLVGAGAMGEAYHKVLIAQDIKHTVLCRSEETAQKFYERTGFKALSGGLDKWLSENQISDNLKAIVATPVEILASNVISLLNSGFKHILVEKPAFLNKSQGEEIALKAKTVGANVWVAYNRRFYSSVFEAQKIIEKDGGISSIQFEFTEWAHVIEPLQKGEGVKEKWFLANSTHVVDLVFFLAGVPKYYNFFTSGRLSWHPTASIFVGAGVTDRGIPFNYGSNWESPGRWAIEIMTEQHRLYLKPMEKLQIQDKGSVNVNSVEIDDILDIEFKPGLYKLVEAYVGEYFHRLPSIKEQLNHYKLYSKIANQDLND